MVEVVAEWIDSGEGKKSVFAGEFEKFCYLESAEVKLMTKWHGASKEENIVK